MKDRGQEAAVKYQIELSAKQMLIILNALEEYVKLRMGQGVSFCDDMAMLCCNLSKENANHKYIFDRYVARREHLNELMQCFFNIAFEDVVGYLDKKTDDMLIAQDIWDSIGVATGRSRWDKPLHVGGEEPVKIKEVNQNG